MRPKQVLFATLASALLLLSPALLAARQGQESVADAARKAQAEKKTPATPAKLITNDNLDTIKGRISVVGIEPAAPATTPEDKSKVTPATAAEDKSKAAPADDK
jgi:hypothetical protein